MIVPFILSVVAGGLFVFLVSYGYQFLAYLGRGLRNSWPTKYQPAEDSKNNHIQIIVLGDIGRSPRMQYHAISIAKHGKKVDIIALKETARHPELIGNPNATLYPLDPLPEWLAWGNLSFLVQIPGKVIQQIWTLFDTMMYRAPAAEWIIIQNPPSIPTFHVALFVAWMRGSKVIIDWHNYGHTILAQKGKLYAPLVPLYRWYEFFFGRRLCNANIAVTDAMAKQLNAGKFNLGKPVHTLHDRPAAIFQPITSLKEREQVLMRIPETQSQAQDILDANVRLIVSSTSWTADEDFSILLSALVAYAGIREVDDNSEPASPILVIITGKGPQRKMYLDKIKELTDGGQLPGIKVVAAWLSNRDYAQLLAAADLGISLHKSSSGVDLPMKVVDMFGAGLPVVAYSKFESFSELVKESINGCGFETASELNLLFKRLLAGDGAEELATLKKGAIKEGLLRWDEEWDRVVAPILGLESKE
ncbi:beta-1,4-mannosyltransferase, putative [Cordyceps militaris CM01]|uniref:Chitobiosyldiphosphodolichol beta-mannosyltransferase n=2 Tax=Cordyceps militaris TaxID=73501 RepID=G3JE13_CORMM|nr:beta-1,4-mannosyltransferase, putative [Cordyceps militaris CM01]ATY64461.1 glycosyltransferase family 33 [Cordyceps militaris]EGX92838.1 beta-1,4-mannosyltransferase, putative [Cordyceps militaris CM01]